MMTTQHGLRDIPLLPDDGNLIHSANGLREQVLTVLFLCKERAGIDALTPYEIHLILRDVFSINASRQMVEAILSHERGTVAKRIVRKRRTYQIMQPGVDAVTTPRDAVVFVDPSQALSSLRNVQTLMSGFQGHLRFCDPYVDSRSLDLIASCTNAVPIDLLTVNVNNERSWRREAAAFATEHGTPLTVRVLANGRLHDRYVKHQQGIALFGTSLNGLGKKQSFVVDLGSDIKRAVSSSYDHHWNSATPL